VRAELLRAEEAAEYRPEASEMRAGLWSGSEKLAELLSEWRSELVEGSDWPWEKLSASQILSVSAPAYLRHRLLHRRRSVPSRLSLPCSSQCRMKRSYCN
jgi:hypothetical protein